MPTPGLPESVAADLSRVTESLQMLAPRWNVWVLMTVAEQPLRYSDIKTRLPWLVDGQLHPKLRKLTDAGLVERTVLDRRNVLYGLSARGKAVFPVLTEVARWGQTHLEKDTAVDPTTGQRVPKAVPKAQDIEDTLTLLAPRHATAILWTLQARGASSAKAIAASVMPDSSLSVIYQPLTRLAEDGLITRDRHRDGHVELTAAGRNLAPVYRALSAWAAGRPLAEAGDHPVGGPAPEPSLATSAGPGVWLTTQPRRPSEPPRPTQAAWKPGDLFSHTAPTRPITPAPAGGRTR
ncbi:winged helix-turn-helix transcriptional regulator [Streptomyces sp. NPDC093801]|uniref:winged helix-turn-helix transcriptional regulator n=1 Tax=Streptomyces sp. NPDC093801 TaxID=3155203 RepID=UPI00344BD623